MGTRLYKWKVRMFDIGTHEGGSLWFRERKILLPLLLFWRTHAVLRPRGEKICHNNYVTEL